MDPMLPVPPSLSLRRFPPLRPSATAGASSRASLPPPVPPSPSTHLTTSHEGSDRPSSPCHPKCHARLLLPHVPLNHHLSSPLSLPSPRNCAAVASSGSLPASPPAGSGSPRMVLVMACSTMQLLEGTSWEPLLST